MLRTQAAIIRLRAYGIMNPDRINAWVEKKIFKKLLLRTSLRLYDAEFMDFNGPNCMCEELLIARSLLKKLHDTCVVASVDPTPLWSYLDTPPQHIGFTLY